MRQLGGLESISLQLPGLLCHNPQPPIRPVLPQVMSDLYCTSTLCCASKCGEMQDNHLTAFGHDFLIVIVPVAGSPGSTLSWGKPVGRWRMEAEEASRQIDQGSRQNQRHSAAPSISDHINARRSQASPGCTAGLPANGQNQTRPRGIIKPNSPATISGIPVHFQYSHRRANDGRGNPGKPGGPRSNREVREVNREFLQSYAEKKRVKFDMEDQVLFIQGRGDLEEEAREDQPNQRSSVLSFRRAASGLFSSIRSVDVTSKSSVNLARELRPCSPQT